MMINPFTHYESDSWLHRRSPVAKLVAHLIVTLAVTVIFDPLTPLAFLLAAAAAGLGLARIGAGQLMSALLPFWALALSLGASNAFLARGGQSAVLWQLGPLTATEQGLSVGGALAGRTLVVATLTLLFMMTTDPTDLVRSLTQHARVPARLAYAMLAAYRFLPLLGDEWRTIRLAQRLRGRGRRHGPLGWVGVQVRTLVPLLAGAIRRADRVAVAMNSRGFDRQEQRTQYRQIPFGRADVVLIAATLLCTVALLLVSAKLGILRLGFGFEL